MCACGFSFAWRGGCLTDVSSVGFEESTLLSSCCRVRVREYISPNPPKLAYLLTQSLALGMSQLLAVRWHCSAGGSLTDDAELERESARDLWSVRCWFRRSAERERSSTITRLCGFLLEGLFSQLAGASADALITFGTTTVLLLYACGHFASTTERILAGKAKFAEQEKLC